MAVRCNLVKDIVIYIKRCDLEIELLDGEVFLPIIEVNGVYLVSNKGRVYSTEKKIIMPLHNNGAGYFSAIIYMKGRTKENWLRYVHRLVAQHFIPNPEGKRFVNHIDHDRSNNCADNLEWVTAKENTAHGVLNGRINSTKRGKTKSISETQRCKAVILKTLGFGVHEIAKSFDLPRTTLSSVFNGRSNAELVSLMQEECKEVNEKQMALSLLFN